MLEPKKTVRISLSDLALMLGYYWSAVHSHLGELGTETYEATVRAIGKQSSIEVTPSQLEHLIFQMKQGIFEKIPPQFIEPGLTRYNHIMKNLKEDVPDLFRQLSSGEIVFK